MTAIFVILAHLLSSVHARPMTAHERCERRMAELWGNVAGAIWVCTARH